MRRFAIRDPFDLAVLAIFSATSVWVLVVRLWWTAAHGRVWTGINGVYVPDVTQYLAWIRDASHHLLVSDLFVVRSTPHDYLQPLVAISGGLVRLGVAPWVALLLWQPIAVGGVFFAARALIGDRLSGRTERRVALVLALFAGVPWIFPDLWLPWWTWGYTFGVLSLAAMIVSLLLYAKPGAPVWPAVLLGGLATWLHPWEGAVLALTIVSAELFRPARPAFSRLIPVLTGIALPLSYYAVLDRTDSAWRLAGRALAGGLPVWQLALMLTPLAVPALLAYRIRPQSLMAAAVRAWPAAAFAVYLASSHGLGNDSMHAFLGVSIPLAVLAVEGVRTVRWPVRVPRRAFVALAVIALTVPVAATKLNARYVLPSASALDRSDSRAIQYLAHDPEPGAVLAALQTGRYIPGETGRRTYIGQVFWSQPGARRREVDVARLLSGDMSPSRAQRFVLSTRARFLLARCGSSLDLGRILAPIVRSSHRFGCAAVYEVGDAPRRGMAPNA